jgi:shikimate dehydrogenase
MKITGKTGLLFMLADPVEHVVGTDMLNRRFAADGLDVAMSPLHVKPADLQAVVASTRLIANVIGFGVTIPHKIAIVPLLDHTTERAARVGSVNFVRRNSDGTLTGDNLDGAGFIDGLAHSGIRVRGQRVLQLGAGGAGRAVAFAIAEAGATLLVIHNRSSGKAEALAADVAAAYTNCTTRAGPAQVQGFDLVVNTTSVGMHIGDPLLVDLSQLPPGCSVAEIIMSPEMTPLLLAAQARGCRIGLGKFMLAEQYKLVKDLLRL